MKRDLDLVRLLLLDTEMPGPQRLAAYAQDVIDYHYKLLIDVGYVDGDISLARPRSSDMPTVVKSIRGLTWNGHDALDIIRDDAIWSKTKEIVSSSTAGTASFGAFLEIAKTLNRIGGT